METENRPLDVSVVPCDAYEPETAKAALREVLAPLGGLDFIKPGDRVVVFCKSGLIKQMDRFFSKKSSGLHLF